MTKDARTKRLIADPKTQAFRPGWFLPYVMLATLAFMGLYPLFMWATDDGSGDPLGMKFILGFGIAFTLAALAAAWYVHARILQPQVWVGPEGLYDRRFMTRALAWDEITEARLTNYRIGKYWHDAVALSTPALDEVARAGPRLRAFNRAMGGMPDLPVQVSGLMGGEATLIAAIETYRPVLRHGNSA